jgi:glycine oxidase
MAGRLAAAGAVAELRSAEEAARLSSGVAAPAGAVFAPEDWRLEPQPMLAAVRTAFEREGGRVTRAALLGFEPGLAHLSDGDIAADAVLLASGLPPAGFAGGPAEMSLLAPIKGQILRVRGAGPRSGPIVRGEGVYVVQGRDGPWIGATMQAGASDRRIEPRVTARLSGLAGVLHPGLAAAEVEAAAGVRSATPDGLPLVGESSRPGVFLALGARRNGWLLAPMVAGLVVKGLAGGPMPARLHAGRFDVACAGVVDLKFA